MSQRRSAHRCGKTGIHASANRGERRRRSGGGHDIIPLLPVGRRSRDDLGELYARFQHPALALASYNAGPGAVAGWMKARGGLPLDAFVEEIPLDETRGYVKRCLRSFAAYQFLYSNGRLPSLGQTLAAR